MGKISTDARKKYFEKLKTYKESIDQIKKREQNISQVVAQGGAGVAYKRLTLAEESLDLVSYYVLMNSLSLSLLDGVKNEAYLNDARKACYKSIIHLEEILTDCLDVPFSEYEEKLNEIEDYEDDKRFYLLRKLGYSIQAVAEGFGENSKWKWSFVEIRGRYATIAKNSLNLKTFITNMDPRVEGYQSRMAHMKLVKELLLQSSDEYRQKYELSTNRIDDFKLALAYLSSLKRIHGLLGEPEESDSLKKKIEVWKAKMESDSKKRDQKEKAKARKGK